MMIPISKNAIQPKIKSNIRYVDSIAEFEKIELDYNEVCLAFDNFKQCFYTKSRDNNGDYSATKILFYETFIEKTQNFEKREFVKKCKAIELDDLKTEVACKFFLDKWKPYDVWIWVTSEKGKDWSWDYVTYLKCSLKKKLFNEIT